MGKFDLDNILSELGVKGDDAPSSRLRRKEQKADRKKHTIDKAEASFSGLPAVPSGQRSFDKQITVAGISARGPARRADIRAGDIILEVAGGVVYNLADLFRSVWALGEAGVNVPLTILRKGRTMEIHLTSVDRRGFLKGPVLH